jgi:hypothetical protein
MLGFVLPVPAGGRRGRRHRLGAEDHAGGATTGIGDSCSASAGVSVQRALRFWRWSRRRRLLLLVRVSRGGCGGRFCSPGDDTSMGGAGYRECLACARLQRVLFFSLFLFCSRRPCRVFRAVHAAAAGRALPRSALVSVLVPPRRRLAPDGADSAWCSYVANAARRFFSGVGVGGGTSVSFKGRPSPSVPHADRPRLSAPRALLRVFFRYRRARPSRRRARTTVGRARAAASLVSGVKKRRRAGGEHRRVVESAVGGRMAAAGRDCCCGALRRSARDATDRV